MNNSHENHEDSEHNDINTKVVKKYYPRQNNGQILDFVFSRDQNLYLPNITIIDNHY